MFIHAGLRVHGNLSVTTTVIMTVIRDKHGLHVYSRLQAGLGNPTKLIGATV